MYQYFDTLTDDSGNSLLGATVTVTNYPSGSLATIYQTNGTTLPIVNSTVTSDITGQISFFAPDGAYTLTYVYKGTTYKIRSPVQLGDPMAFVAATDTGSANLIVVAGSQYPAQLYTGLKLEVLIAATNTGTTTLTYQGGAAQPVRMSGGTLELSPNLLQAGALARFEWDGSRWQLFGSTAPPFYARTPAEIAAGVTVVNYYRWPGNVLRYGTNTTPGTTDMTAAIQAAINQAQQTGSYPSRVYVPIGQYRTTAPLTATPQVQIIGEQRGAYSSAIAYTGGTWFIKDHDGVFLTVQGSVAYAGPGHMSDFTVVSNKATWPSSSGHGLVLDKVGTYCIERVSVLTVGGDAFHLGTSGGDVTGHIYLTDVYANNPGGVCYAINAKWCQLHTAICDGGTYSLYAQGNSSELSCSNYHFEGATVGGVYVTGVADANFGDKGFLGNTASHNIGFEFANVSGTQCAKVSKCHMVGPSATGKTAIKINGSSNFAIEIESCNIVLWETALDDDGNGTQFHHNTIFGGFGSTCKGIKINGATAFHYHFNNFSGSTSGFSIDHLSGSGGEITDNDLDQTIKATSTGVNGDFGTIYVDRNRGYKTSVLGATGSIASGTNVAHGLAGTPANVMATPYSGTYTNWAVGTTDATNIALTWSGGGNVAYYYQAKLKCAIQL